MPPLSKTAYSEGNERENCSESERDTQKVFIKERKRVLGRRIYVVKGGGWVSMGSNICIRSVKTRVHLPDARSILYRFSISQPDVVCDIDSTWVEIKPFIYVGRATILILVNSEGGTVHGL